MRKRHALSIVLLTATLSTWQGSLKAVEVWTGADNSLWNNDGNWTAAIPNNELALIDTPTNNPVILNAAAAHPITQLVVGLTGPSSLTLNGTGSLITTDAGNSVSLGVFAGSTGVLTLDGAATSLTLDGGNGTVQLASAAGSAGTLNFGDNSAAGTLVAAAINGGAGLATVNFDNTANYTLGAAITGSTIVNQNGPATTTLTGVNTYSGLTTISAGTLVYTNDTSGLGGDIVDNAALVFDQAANSSFNGVISGAGTVTKSSAGALTLTGANTYDGLTTISAGTLIFTNDTSGLGGNIVDNSALVFDQAANSSFNGVISGPGTVTKDGAGALTLNGASTYNGLTTINAGTLIFTNDTSGLGGNMVNNSEVVFNQALNSSFNQMISGPGTLTKDGAGALTLSDVNTYSGLTTINRGTLIFTNDTSKLGGNIVDNAALVFNQNMDSSFNNAINGPGTLTKDGAGTLTLNGVSSVGETTVLNGGLLVDNLLQATQVNVAAPGLLGGTGLIISDVTNAGTLAPGHNGVGTLNIQGNYTQTSTGAFQLQIAGKNNFDRLLVSGRASLAGSLNAISVNGYKPSVGQQFPFLMANGGIGGKFKTITGDFSDSLRSRLFVQGNTVVLVFAPSKYEAMAITQNQRNVARALDHYIGATKGDRAKVTLALDQLTPKEFPPSFDAISPAQYEALANITVEEANAQTQMLEQRFSSLRLGARGFQTMNMALNALHYDKDGKGVMEAKDGKNIFSPAPENKWGVWVQGNGIFAHNAGINNVPSYRFDTGGVLIGADYRLTDSITAGVYTGYQGTYARFANGGRTTINAAKFGLYATYDSHNGFYANTILSGGYSGYQVRRPIAFGTLNRATTSTPDGGEFGAALNLGYDWKIGHFTFGPVVSGQYTYVGIAPFTESGADSLDLRVNQQNANSLRTFLGGRVAYNWKLSDSIAIIPEGRMFWQHEFLEYPRDINSTLAGGSGPNFQYSTASPDRDAVYAGTGLTLQLGDQWTVNANYNVEFGRTDFISHMVSGGVNFSF